MVHFIADVEEPSGQNAPKPPPEEPYHVSEPPYEGYHEIDHASHEKSSANDAIVIDSGMSSIQPPAHASQPLGRRARALRRLYRHTNTGYQALLPFEPATPFRSDLI